MHQCLYILASVFLLSACASPPLYLKFDDGKLLQGTGMNGSYTIKDIDGYNCSGTYPIAFIMPTFDMPITCSDGATGIILMTMNGPDYDSGFGRGRLSDGREFKVTFGGTNKRQAVPSILKDEKPVVKK